MSDSKPRKGLGKGLSALLGEAPGNLPTQSDSNSPQAGVFEIEIGRIQPNPRQPRQVFDDSGLAELALSIAERGVLQPILVRPSGNGYEIIAGERRWRAAQRAQLHRIPAIVRASDDASSAELALIENIQREDLNAIEEAAGYSQLIGRYGHSQEEVAKLVRKSRSHIANLLRLLELPEPVQQMLMRSEITMGHARAIASSPDPESLAREVVAKGLSVRQAETRARQAKAGEGELVLKTRTADADLEALERQLGDVLGLKVHVTHKGRGGSVTLVYSSLDQLDMICQRLSGEPI